MCDELEQNQTLGGHRGSVGPDAMWKILNDNIGSFHEMIDNLGNKDTIIETLADTEEEFTHALCGGGDDARDKMTAES